MSTEEAECVAYWLRIYGLRDRLMLVPEPFRSRMVAAIELGQPFP